MHDDILDAQFVSKWYMPEDIDYEKLETRVFTMGWGSGTTVQNTTFYIDEYYSGEHKKIELQYSDLFEPPEIDKDVKNPNV